MARVSSVYHFHSCTFHPLQMDMVVAKLITQVGLLLQDLGLSLYPPSKIPQEHLQDLSQAGSIARDGSFVRNEKAFNSIQRTPSRASRLNAFDDVYSQ